MAQWTHVLGIIRYEYIAQNTWSSETKGKPDYYNPKEKIAVLKQMYQDMPADLEGRLEVCTFNSERGPVVTIMGDLRHFYQEDVQIIQEWLNSIDARVKTYNEDKVYHDRLEVRDAIVLCDVEYKATILFVYKDDSFREHETRDFAKYKAFWDDARLADKMQWERNEWPKHNKGV